MDLVVTFTLKDAILLLLGIAALIAIIYLIILLKNLVPAAKNMNAILEDTKQITGIAAESAEDAKTVVGDASKIVTQVSDAIKGNQSTLTAVTTLINALTSLKNLIEKAKRD